MASFSSTLLVALPYPTSLALPAQIDISPAAHPTRNNLPSGGGVRGDSGCPRGCPRVCPQQPTKDFATPLPSLLRHPRHAQTIAPWLLTQGRGRLPEFPARYISSGLPYE